MQKENKMIVVGVIDADGFIQDNKVYFRGGCAPTLRATNDKNRTIRKIKKNNTERSDGRRI